MELYANIQERPDVSAEERASSELVKRIRKLRWIGMEEEAARIQNVLRFLHPVGIELTDPWPKLSSCDTAARAPIYRRGAQSA
jgi:hypothetical protein